ncbi:hypothetical protein [Amycolatopsis sp. 195334CR]|uniref:hypothetical protein n=1 Tax=Amycolatopsis sp. 195334CR TaxID=2814588 RepID=UPI001A8DB1C8|nr:hypothetical protein [Amycolatopsis sp. 195334CR]MBN6039031.1 hypothetical protein [Amycolatopsis sp. 195334CR]
MKELGRHALVVLAVALWWLGSDWLAGISADARLACRADQLTAFSGAGLVLWRFGSALLFLLAAALFLLLLKRGRRLVAAGVCVVLAGLITWGQVATTHTVMRYSVEHGVLNGLPQDAQGQFYDPCDGTGPAASAAGPGGAIAGTARENAA